MENMRNVKVRETTQYQPHTSKPERGNWTKADEIAEHNDCCARAALAMSGGMWTFIGNQVTRAT